MGKNVNENGVHPLWWLVYLGLVFVFLFILSAIQVAMDVKFRFGALWWTLIFGGCIWLARAICRKRPQSPSPALPGADTKPAEEKEGEESAPLSANEAPLPSELTEMPEAPDEPVPAESSSPAEGTFGNATAPSPAPENACTARRPGSMKTAAIISIMLLVCNLAVMLYMAHTLDRLCTICRAEPYSWKLNQIDDSLTSVSSRLGTLDSTLERIRSSMPSGNDGDDSSDSEELRKIRQLVNEISGYIYDMEKNLQRLENIESRLEGIDDGVKSVEWNTEGIRSNTRRY